VLSRGVSFDLRRGEKAALIGPNGVGKSTLLKVLLGRLPAEGEVYWGDKVQLAYYEQENLNLNKENTALEELWGRWPRLVPYEMRGLLGQVLISGDNVEKPVGVLSGGERARVALAVVMQEHGNVLLLDEPTNHLDLQSKEALEKALVDFPGTLLFVSHDRYFLNAIPTKIIRLQKEGLEIYEGNFDEYLRQSAARREAAPPAPAKEAEEPQSGEGRSYRSRQERAEQVRRRSRLAALEKLIREAEEQEKALEAEMALPETSSDYEKLSALCDELAQVKAQHEAYFSEWAELAE